MANVTLVFLHRNILKYGLHETVIFVANRTKRETEHLDLPMALRFTDKNSVEIKF